jgi:tetratricopeptide (TPR) repeat protein
MRILLLFALFFLFFEGKARAESSSIDDEARSAFQQGIAAFDQGRVSDALVLFERAYSLRPAFKLLYNIGQAQADLKLFRQAIQSFERYLSEGKEAVEPERRAEVEAEISRLRLLSGTPAETEVPAGETITMKITISAHRKVGNALALAPWVTAGVALTTGTLGTVFGVRALSLNNSLSDNCTGGKCPSKYADDVDSMNGSALAADVLLISTGVLTAAAVSLFVVVHHKKKGKSK